MMQPEKLQQLIAAGIACTHVEVTGDGQHFEARIVSDDFVGKSRVARQQHVNGVLRAYFDSSELHALSMQTLTTAEWSAARG
ncbi:BolA family protein [Rhodocyclus gracilis]|uniref:BolA/IbaG family iron-sulfur metabolism protein n=1 Tax=Rhodocyclus tenuis TaxID=1066 RepID=A0A6L5K0G9_RHOTE|nr:BolA/IbaG family iron-sulfur metabolism protein [Rhodocyclus gracilis]MQY52612.1 BolA/IbaG family iron-sulfur metabolism protein [Rhodocyclus gracilis]